MITRNFTSFPILTTERLTLRRLSMDDRQNIFAMRSDTEINKYLDREPCKTMEGAINFINKVTDNFQKSNSLYWVITLTKTKAFLGTICIFNFSDETNSCEIGYELMVKFQGKGMMKEAIEKVISYAFQTLQFQKIVAHTHNKNLGSTKLLTGSNFLPSKKADNYDSDVTIFTLTHKQ